MRSVNQLCLLTLICNAHLIEPLYTRAHSPQINLQKFSEREGSSLKKNKFRYCYQIQRWLPCSDWHSTVVERRVTLVRWSRVRVSLWVVRFGDLTSRLQGSKPNRSHSAVLPVLELGRLGIAHPHINSDVVEWQTHQRDIWITDHECHIQIMVNTSHKHSQTRYNTHNTLPDGIRRDWCIHHGGHGKTVPFPATKQIH